MRKNSTPESERSRFGVAAGCLGIALLTVVLLRLHYDGVARTVASSERFQVKPGNVKWNAPPAPIRPHADEDLWRRFSGFRPRSAFDEDLVSAVGTRLRASPWVWRVDSIEKVFPNEVRAKVQWRRPAVFVYDGAYQLVSEDGVRLPVTRTTLGRDYVGIIGVAGCTPPVGCPWTDEAVEGAVKLVARLKGSAAIRKLGLAAVDVSNYLGRREPCASEVVLFTRSNVRVMWGQLYPSPSEPSVESKLTRLQSLATKQGISEVDLRLAEPAGGSL